MLLASTGANGAIRDGSGGVSAAAVQALFDTAPGAHNNTAYPATLAGVFRPGSSELGATASDPSLIDPRFEPALYVGAVAGPEDDWFSGWTCDSATADFGSGSACTSLPSLED